MSNSQKNAGKISLAVFGSRILGLIREVVLTSIFGPGRELDAFTAAFRIPNLLRDLFAEGALSTAFVTTFSKLLKTEGKEKAFRLANLVLTSLAIIMVSITLLGVLLAEPIAHLTAPGFAAPTAPTGKMELCIELLRIFFPFITFVSLAALFMGLLNSLGSFGLPASASMVFNLTSIILGLAFGYLFDPDLGINAIYGFAIGTTLGGLAQLLIQIPRALQFGFRPAFLIDWKDPSLRHIGTLMTASILGGAAVQVNVLISQWFASRLEDGTVTWLYCAFRLMMLPIGMFGVAFATVTLPAVSRAAAADDKETFRHELSSGIGNVLFLTIPAAVGLFLLAEPIVSIIFERGNFHSHDTHMTALALQGYTIGLAAYACIKVLSGAFFPLGLARIPAQVSAIGIIINLALCYVLTEFFSLGVLGLALATAGVALMNALQLLLRMRTAISTIGGIKLAKDTALIILASTIMGIIITLTYQAISHHLTSFITKTTALALIITLGATTYFGLCFAFHLPQTVFLKKILRKFSSKNH